MRNRAGLGRNAEILAVRIAAMIGLQAAGCATCRSSDSMAVDFKRRPSFAIGSANCLRGL